VNTQEYGRRPYGVGFLVIGQDKTGPHLYEFSPSGNSYEYYAMSIGARSQSAKTYLEKHYESFADSAYIPRPLYFQSHKNHRLIRRPHTTRATRPARDSPTRQRTFSKKHLHWNRWPRRRARNACPSRRLVPHPRRRFDQRLPPKYGTQRNRRSHRYRTTTHRRGRRRADGRSMNVKWWLVIIRKLRIYYLYNITSLICWLEPAAITWRQQQVCARLRAGEP
jgi:hypothetical protein